MKCFVYRSPRKLGAFLFMASKGDFSELPDSLLALFGEPEFSFEFILTIDRELKIGDAKEVLKQITEQGFYLQLPLEEKESS
jgi:uncharacterized protein YcgL (UPF0745 family)